MKNFRKLLEESRKTKELRITLCLHCPKQYQNEAGDFGSMRQWTELCRDIAEAVSFQRCHHTPEITVHYKLNCHVSKSFTLTMSQQHKPKYR